MLLDQLLTQAIMEVDLEKVTLDQYRRAIRKYGEWLNKPADETDLTLDKINGFLASLKARGLTGTTVQNYKSALTRIWNYAVDRNLVQEYNPRRLRTPRIDRPPVRSWTSSQVRMLLTAADRMEGSLRCGIKVSHFVAAWVRIGYDTGLRPVDLRLLRWSNIDLSTGSIAIVQHKTRKPHTAKISIDAVRMLDRICNPAREFVFPLTKSGVRRLELLLYQYAQSVGFRRIKGQGIGTLRKTHATEIYRQEGESAAAESLGHVGGVRTVRTCYIDGRAVKNGRLPPEPPAA
jgi:integrase